MHRDQPCIAMIVYNMASIVIVEIVPMCSSVFTKIYKHFLFLIILHDYMKMKGPSLL